MRPPIVASVPVVDLVTAWLEEREAVLRFAFDERLKALLRAIPGRRWDPIERVWRVALTPESAESVAGWLAALSPPAHIEPALETALATQRAARDPDECLIELVRFDDDRWLTCCADAPCEPVAALIAHPRALTLPAIARVLLPLDDEAAELVRVACLDHPRAWLSPAAERAVAEREALSARVPSVPERIETVPRTDVSVARAAGEPVFVIDGTPGRGAARACRAEPGRLDPAAQRGQLGADHAPCAGADDTGRRTLCRRARARRAAARRGARAVADARRTDLRAGTRV